MTSLDVFLTPACLRRDFVAGSLIFAGSVVLVSPLAAQPAAPLPFRPIGSPSRVDQPAFDPTIRQVAMQSGGFALPPLNNIPLQNTPPPTSPPSVYTVPPGAAPPLMPPPSAVPMPGAVNPGTPGPAVRINPAPPPAPQVQVAPPPTLPPVGSIGSTVPRASDPRLLDYQPIMPPQLANGGFATMSDCRMITPPSGYAAYSPYAGKPNGAGVFAATAYGGNCGGQPMTAYATPVGYVPPPTQIAAPAAMPPLSNELAATLVQPPPGIPTTVVPADAVPAGSLVNFGQGNVPVQVAPGLWGQPVAYVPGQRCRNWLRYFSF